MRTLCFVLTALLGAALASPAPAATCYQRIQDLSCWGAGKKCNIKFRNETGEGSGSGGSDYNQVSWAKTMKVLAVKPNGNRAGSNTLSILAGASNTLNLDKKDGFEEILIRARPDEAESKFEIRMTCEEVLATLEGSGVCKVFIDEGKTEGGGARGGLTLRYVAFSCAGGSVRASARDR